MDKKSQAEEIFNIAKSFVNHPAEYADILVTMQKRRLMSSQSLKNNKKYAHNE